MFYPYDPKRLTKRDKEDAEKVADDLFLEGSFRRMFIAALFCGIQNRYRQIEKNRKAEQDDD